jgi:hypothetical protein
MRTTLLALGPLLLSLPIGCAVSPDEPVETSTLAAKPDTAGTALCVTAGASEPVCADSGEADVTVSGVLTSTGSADSAVVTVRLDGEPPVAIGTIEPGDFEHDGREKHAAYSYDFKLPDGTHTIELCFEQSGAQGNPDKAVCTETLVVVVDCPVSILPSCDESVFGDLVGNPALCSGRGTPHVPVHLSGDFGEQVTLNVQGPSGFTFDGLMNHAGKSCNYHFNWDTRAGNHGGTGIYTFTFAGDNGNSFSFSRNLDCPE